MWAAVPSRGIPCSLQHLTGLKNDVKLSTLECCRKVFPVNSCHSTSSRRAIFRSTTPSGTLEGCCQVGSSADPRAGKEWLTSGSTRIPLVRQIKHERPRLQWLTATQMPTYHPISLAGLTPSTCAGSTAAKRRGHTAVTSLMRRTLMRQLVSKLLGLVRP